MGTDGSCMGGTPPSRGGHREMAQRNGQEKTSWWLGKTSKTQSREEKKKNHLISTPHPTTAKKLMSWEQVAEVPHL